MGRRNRRQRWERRGSKGKGGSSYKTLKEHNQGVFWEYVHLQFSCGYVDSDLQSLALCSSVLSSLTPGQVHQADFTHLQSNTIYGNIGHIPILFPAQFHVTLSNTQSQTTDSLEMETDTHTELRCGGLACLFCNQSCHGIFPKIRERERERSSSMR